ncbi:hypothetical protein BDQ17DRAFT_1547135 [Cyathus striatus]|nr:hypothetical protein BDQ17DRAFT_1547135 [Cyathus striatus]
MSYQPSNALLHASIYLANISFAYTLPIIGRAFPFHIVTIIAYTLTLVYHAFVLSVAQNRPFKIKITTDDDQQEEKTLFIARSISISPSSNIGAGLSVILASLWIGTWISRIVFMSIKYSNASFMGLIFLMLEASLSSYIAVRSVISRLNDNGVNDLQELAKKGINYMQRSLGDASSAIAQPNAARPVPSAVGQERKDE